MCLHLCQCVFRLQEFPVGSHYSLSLSFLSLSGSVFVSSCIRRRPSMVLTWTPRWISPSLGSLPTTTSMFWTRTPTSPGSRSDRSPTSDRTMKGQGSSHPSLFKTGGTNRVNKVRRRTDINSQLLNKPPLCSHRPP